MNTQMDRVRGLDGVRGFASLCIVGFHVLYFGDYLGSSKSADALFLRGDCFVRLFFMLSGFSLMCAYHKRFCDGKFDIATYLKRRAIRILPCFLLVELAYIFINMYAGNPNSVYEIIGTTSMLFALFPTGQDSIVAAGWSTGIQVAFYLLFPAFLVGNHQLRDIPVSPPSLCHFGDVYSKERDENRRLLCTSVPCVGAIYRVGKCFPSPVSYAPAAVCKLIFYKK